MIIRVLPCMISRTRPPPSSLAREILGDRYFYDKWNFLDVTTVLFVFLAFIFRMMELATGNPNHLILAQCFLASTAPLLFSRVLFLSQIGSALGPMTQVRRAAWFCCCCQILIWLTGRTTQPLYSWEPRDVSRCFPRCFSLLFLVARVARS